MRRGQSTIEYALLIAIVAAAFTAMHLYMQRAVQANFKLIEEQVNAEPVQGQASSGTQNNQVDWNTLQLFKK